MNPIKMLVLSATVAAAVGVVALAVGLTAEVAKDIGKSQGALGAALVMGLLTLALACASLAGILQLSGSN